MAKKWAYYNEWDKKAAEWIRQLIKLGAIAPGEVDERSITDVRADDLRSFQQIHLFAGVAGWSYSLRQAGWDDDRPIFTGSCPCQPFSSNGKQLGFADERHLWGEMFRLIRELEFEFVAGEQVASKAAITWWDTVAHDLESEGYAAAAVDLSGGSAGAPHIRSRLYWLGHKLGNSPSNRQQWSGQKGTVQERREPEPQSRGQLPQGSQGSGTTSPLDDTHRTVPTIGIDRISSQGDTEIGRLLTTTDHGGSPTSLPATFWDECEWIECRDGKRRPTGVGIAPLVGVPNLDKEYIRRELERCAERLFSEWNDADRSQKAQMFARLILETRNVGAIVTKVRTLADGLPTDLAGSSNAGGGEDCDTQKFRTMKLKGIGNSLVIPVAVEFLRAVMEIIDA